MCIGTKQQVANLSIVAVMGRRNDFFLKTTTVSPRPREEVAVRVAVYEDQVALELNETFQLKLTQAKTPTLQTNEVFLDTINVTIIDQESKDTNDSHVLNHFSHSQIRYVHMHTHTQTV